MALRCLWWVRVSYALKPRYHVTKKAILRPSLATQTFYGINIPVESRPGTVPTTVNLMDSTSWIICSPEAQAAVFQRQDLRGGIRPSETLATGWSQD